MNKLTAMRWAAASGDSWPNTVGLATGNRKGA
jgi:hypothetical protein